MSTIEFDKKVFARIVETILIKDDYTRCVISYEEQETLKRDAYSMNRDVYQFLKTNIVWFVNRLYMSNQIAYYRDYMLRENEPITFEPLEEKDLSVLPFNRREFLKTLTSLEYNISDGNGNIFLPSRDMERLDCLIRHIALGIAIYND